LVEAFTRHVLGYQEGPPLHRPDAIRGHDIGVIQPGGGPPLDLEALDSPCVTGIGAANELDRHQSIEAHVVIEVHHAHPPTTQRAPWMVLLEQWWLEWGRLPFVHGAHHRRIPGAAQASARRVGYARVDPPEVRRDRSGGSMAPVSDS